MPSHSTRRTLLACLGALVGGSSAGCLDRSPLPGSAGDPVPPDEYRRRLSVRQVDSLPNAFEAAFDVEVAHETITATQSAVLRIRIENASMNERTFPTPYYKGASSDTGTPGILLYSERAPDNPAGNDSLSAYAPPCVGTDGKSHHDLRWTNEAQPQPTLAPNESWTDRLLVADDPTDVGCLPTGTYRFERRLEPPWMDDGFDWGFTLEIEG